jgi:hypothetical protein
VNIKFKGIVITVIVIAFGLLLLLPVYIQKQAKSPVMLSFNIVKQNNDLPKWCSELDQLISNNGIKAIVFITGKLAASNPECLKQIIANENIDIGSSTYDYVDLTSIPNYTNALGEVSDGKKSIDTIGNISSKIFRAPFGKTDQNIYSFLSRSGIMFDLSYNDKYNLFQNDLFIKYNLKAINGSNITSEQLGSEISMLKQNGEPILINYDNTVPLTSINNTISEIKSSNNGIMFTNPSDLIKENLTVRKENQS